MIRSVFPLLLAVLLLAGCDTAVQPPIPDPPDELEVYSVVQAFDSTQYALVSWPRPADERSTRYVQDATVELAGRSLPVVREDSLDPFGGRRRLARPGVDKANYRTDSLSVQPGETVRLRVSTDSHEVTGTAQVPGTFSGTVDSMTVRWRPSAGAERYKVRVRRYDDVGGLEWEYITITTDTATTVPEEVDAYSGSFQPGPHGVIITAVDSNLVGYRKESVCRSGIEEGFGVFGAITRIGATVTLPATGKSKRIDEALRLRPRSSKQVPAPAVGH